MKMDESFDIRPGNGDDLMLIAGVLVDTWRTTFRGLLADAFLDGMSRPDEAVRHARRMAAPGVAYSVAVERATGAVVGFANYGPARAKLPRHVHELYALYVRSEYQRRGIGAGLVTTVARGCRGNGARSCFAWVLASNPNRLFYERLGARATESAKIGLGGQSYDQIAYVWDDLDSLCSLP